VRGGEPGLQRSRGESERQPGGEAEQQKQENLSAAKNGKQAL